MGTCGLEDELTRLKNRNYTSQYRFARLHYDQLVVMQPVFLFV